MSRWARWYLAVILRRPLVGCWVSSPVKKTAVRISLLYVDVPLRVCNSVYFLLLLPASVLSYLQVFLKSQTNFSLGLVDAACLYHLGTSAMLRGVGGTISLQCWYSQLQGTGTGCFCCNQFCGSGRRLCYPNLPILNQTWVQDAEDFPSPLQVEWSSCQLSCVCFVFFAGCGLLIAERYSWKRVSIFPFNLCPELLRSYCCFFFGLSFVVFFPVFNFRPLCTSCRELEIKQALLRDSRGKRC